MLWSCNPLPYPSSSCHLFSNTLEVAAVSLSLERKDDRMAGKRIVAVGVGVACLPILAFGGDWTQFRGPNNSGVVSDSVFPNEWSLDKNLAWKEKVPGYGWSSPIVVGDKIIVTTAVSDKQVRPKAFGGGRFGPPG